MQCCVNFFCIAKWYIHTSIYIYTNTYIYIFFFIFFPILVYHKIWNIVPSIDLNSLLWPCIGLKLGTHNGKIVGSSVSSLCSHLLFRPLSWSLASSLSSKVGARGGEGGLTGQCSCNSAWYYDVPSPGHWPLLLGPSDCTLTPEAVLLVGHLLWPPKPVIAFCTHTAYMPVLTALCTAHPQSLSPWLVPLREAPFIT